MYLCGFLSLRAEIGRVYEVVETSTGAIIIVHQRERSLEGEMALSGVNNFMQIERRRGAEDVCIVIEVANRRAPRR